MNLHGKLFVGDRLEIGDGKKLRVSSPLDGAHLDQFFQTATQEHVDRAMDLAGQATETYGQTTGKQRGEFLERIGAEILLLGEALIDRCHLETGLPKERLTSERGRTVNQLNMFASLVREGSWIDACIDTAQPDRKPLPKPDVRRMLIPLGPVVVFGSSNFPLAFSVAGGDTASALAAGCPVVVKAHSAHPGTSELVATAVRKAVEGCSLPAGTFSMLHGSGSVIGIALVKHPHTRAVGFTGSREAGRALFDAAAARPDPIPVFAEMSSLNPLFLLPHALKERGAQIAEGLKHSFTLGVGQFCTKPGLVFGLEGEHQKQFENKLVELVEASAPATMLHQGIWKSFQAGLAHAAAVSGIERIARSKQAGDECRTHGEPVVMKTTVSNFLREPQLAEEVFGPFTLIITGKTMGELEQVARALEGQLTATMHATEEDLRDAGNLVEILKRKAGRLVMNSFPTGVEVCASMHHGGPYPATTDARFTSVGTGAIFRFARPICYQNFPKSLLPAELQDHNPLGIWRLVNGELKKLHCVNSE